MGSSARAPTPLRAPVRRDGWWWSHRRSRSYVLFGLASILVLGEAALLLAGLWSLGGGEPSWQRFTAALRTPAARLLHLAAAPIFLWYAARFVRLFPRTQPPRLDLPGLPEALRRRPPLHVLFAAACSIWLAALAVGLAALAGWLG